ncbi:MAG: radical SAM protein [Verrucomicrobiota bacterium]
MAETLLVNEIYLSLQGESTFAGLPCIFVRMTGCDLRCSYCDTAYAFKQGHKLSIPAVLAEIDRLALPFTKPAAGAPRWPLVELTGGEPLLQRLAIDLMKQLCDRGFKVLVETSGAHDVTPVDDRVHRIIDLKCPSSGEVSRNRYANLLHLRSSDEIKFVIATWQDYAWAKTVIAEHRLSEKCAVLLSWAAPLTDEQRDPSLKTVPAGQSPMTRRELAEQIVADALPVRFQVQMHKVIWAPDARGV